MEGGRVNTKGSDRKNNGEQISRWRRNATHLASGEGGESECRLLETLCWLHDLPYVTFAVNPLYARKPTLHALLRTYGPRTFRPDGAVPEPMLTPCL
jgi:hypothetical protein